MPTLCPTRENLDLVYRETSDSKARHIPGRPNVVADKLSRLGQTIQTVVSPSRGLPLYAAGGTGPNRLICHEVQPQVACVCVTGTGSPGHSSGCALKAYTFPPSAILGKGVEKLQDSPCKRIILIAPGWLNKPWFWDLVATSNQIPLSLPNMPNLLTAIQSDPSQKSDKP